MLGIRIRVVDSDYDWRIRVLILIMIGLICQIRSQILPTLVSYCLTFLLCNLLILDRQELIRSFMPKQKWILTPRSSYQALTQQGVFSFSSTTRAAWMSIYCDHCKSVLFGCILLSYSYSCLRKIDVNFKNRTLIIKESVR